MRNLSSVIELKQQSVCIKHNTYVHNNVNTYMYFFDLRTTNLEKLKLNLKSNILSCQIWTTPLSVRPISNLTCPNMRLPL